MMALRKTSEPPKRNSDHFAHNESLQRKSWAKSTESSHLNLYTSSWKKEDSFCFVLFSLGKVDSRSGKSSV